MSGPKVSEYELEEMRRLQLEAERLLREAEELEREMQRQRHRELLQRRDEYISSLRKMEQALPDHTELIKAGKERLGDESVAKELAGIKENISKKVAELQGLQQIQDNDELERQLVGVPKELANIRKQARGLGAVADEALARLNAALSEDIVGLFETDETEKAEVDTELIRVRQSLESLDELRQQKHLPAAYQTKLQQAVEGIRIAKASGNIAGYCAIELPELLKPCEKFIALWAKDGKEYQKLSLQYEILLRQNGTEQAELVPFNAKAVEKLKKLVAVEEVKAQQAAERAYIAAALDETMTEMGYDVIGHREVTKRSGKHFRNELYRYGDDTAINITYSDDGQIALELGKLDQADRVPTADESNYLANQMAGFCERFKELEERLQRKGVKPGKRIALAPPSADYAQIINSSDYRMEEKQEVAAKRKSSQKGQGLLEKSSI